MQASQRARFATLALVVPSMLLAAPPPGTRLSFVSCPIIRDTRSVPCWLSDYQSERYYLTIQSDVSAEVQPPLMGHQVLVEGIVSDAPQICGGVVLSQVHLSAMPELDANCREELPADDRYVIDFNPRPPGPSGGKLAFAADPSTTNAPPRAAAPPASGPQKIDVYFDFDKGVSFRHPAALVSILNAARRGDAKRVRITGVRGAHRLSNGMLLQEASETGRRRAEDVARLLKGAGLTLPADVSWVSGEKDADGVDDWRSRRVTVELLP
ncbi:MAG: hypothetical protein ABI645_03425 [Pseudomonadota bacterium]